MTDPVHDVVAAIGEGEIRLPDGFVIRKSDTFWPPMSWVTVWKDGVAHEPSAALRIALGFHPYFSRGLWLFSDEGHGKEVADAGPELAGRTVTAYTGAHAVHVLAMGKP